MLRAVEGSKYVFDGSEEGHGFGRVARGEELSAEMQELDLKPGMPVTVVAIDEATGWPIIHWIDAKSINRHTTIDPDEFGSLFTEAEGEPS